MAKGEKNYNKANSSKDGAVGFTLFLMFVGSAVYFINQVDGFGNIIVAIGKAIVWPAILIYNVLQFFTAWAIYPKGTLVRRWRQTTTAQ